MLVSCVSFRHETTRISAIAYFKYSGSNSLWPHHMMVPSYDELHITSHARRQMKLNKTNFRESAQSY